MLPASFMTRSHRLFGILSAASLPDYGSTIAMRGSPFMTLFALALAGNPASAFTQRQDATSTTCAASLPSSKIEHVCRAEMLRLSALIGDLNTEIVASKRIDSDTNDAASINLLSARQRAASSLSRTLNVLGARRRAEEALKNTAALKELKQWIVPKSYAWPDAARPQSFIAIRR